MITTHDEKGRPTYAIVDKYRFGRNIDKARNLSKSDIVAVVKANAYGHGARVLSEYAYSEKNVKNFAVATMEEGISLKEYLPKDANVIVMGYITEASLKEAAEAGLTLPVFDDKCGELISKTAKAIDKRIKVVIEVDTGMSRLGIEHTFDLSQFLVKYDNIDILYVMSHLATSDSDVYYAREQMKKFDKFLEINKKYSFATSFLNSSGIVNFENRWTFTRPGLFLYGYESSGVLNDLEPVMSIKSAIIQVKKLKLGQSVGYGRTFIAHKDMYIGVVPIGYADGYLRSFSNKGYMLCNGIKCPVVGNVCMDMTMIDVTPFGMDAANKEVEVMGDNITANDWAIWENSISYEMLCGVSYRVPRVYGEWQ